MACECRSFDEKDHAAACHGVEVESRGDGGQVSAHVRRKPGFEEARSQARGKDQKVRSLTMAHIRLGDCLLMLKIQFQNGNKIVAVDQRQEEARCDEWRLEAITLKNILIKESLFSHFLCYSSETRSGHRNGGDAGRPALEDHLARKTKQAIQRKGGEALWCKPDVLTSVTSSLQLGLMKQQLATTSRKSAYSSVGSRVQTVT